MCKTARCHCPSCYCMKCLDYSSMNKIRPVQTLGCVWWCSVCCVRPTVPQKWECQQQIKSRAKKSFTESLNVNVFSFLNILSSASVWTNSTAAAEFHVSRRTKSCSSPAPWAKLRDRRQATAVQRLDQVRPDQIVVGPSLQSNWTGVRQTALAVLTAYRITLPLKPTFLGAFIKLRKATIRFVMSVCVCPSVRMWYLSSHWTDFL